VAAVERAVSATGYVIVDMADFPATDQPPAQLCQKRVQGCDVYVGILGTRYGSPVRDKPGVSYTELEFDAATEVGLPRLVFLLDTEASDVGIPPSRLIDHEFGRRQAAFRHRVQNSGLVTQKFTDPASLGQLVERSLRELAAQDRRGAGSQHVTPAEERRILLRATRVMRSGESLKIEIFDAELANQWIKNDPWASFTRLEPPDDE
jgi:Domain of unknown function (DUF4062)